MFVDEHYCGKSDMAEFQGDESKKENGENGNAFASEKEAHGLEERQDLVPPFYTEASHGRYTPVFQNVPTEDISLTDACVSQISISDNQHSASESQVESDLPTQSIDSGSYDSGRPGTPALCRTNLETLYHDVSSPYSGISDDQCTYVAGTQIENYPPIQRLVQGASLEDPSLLSRQPSQPAVSPSQLYSLLAALQGNNTTRNPDASVLDQQQEISLLPSFHHRLSNLIQNRNAQQGECCDSSDKTRHIYPPQQQQRHSFGSESDVDHRSSVNRNFNNLHHNMVRLKHASGNDDAKIVELNGAHGQECVEDREGNHDCHDLRHETTQESHKPNEDSENPGAPSISPLSTGAAEMQMSGRTELRGFSALGATIYQGEWPMNRALWMSGPSSVGEKDPLIDFARQDAESIMSFSSSTAIGSSRRPFSHQLGTKVEMVYSLLSMLGSNNKDDMSRTLLEMSSNQESCIAMRQTGCLPLLIQLLHGGEHDHLITNQDPNAIRWALRDARRRASQALHNIVYAHPDDKKGRREARVLRLLEQIRDYSDYLRDIGSGTADVMQNENLDMHPGPAIAALMKLSFDEEHRHAMCLLGGLQAIAELIQADHEVHGNTVDQFCVTVRRYAGMALTNLTFGDGTNKALLCSMKPFMQALVTQLHSLNEDLRQVTASVLRNLSWRADVASKQILKEVGAVVTLMKVAMEATKESTLKSILSALWNLSAHCSINKADICAIDGALTFLVSTLTYKSTSKTLSIVENGGGILRNISSHIAIREDYRGVLRKQKCLQTLLLHLKSPSLTVVSNACGTLWNLSARCSQDQHALWEMGAVGMLRNLIHSKHKMISMGSSAALKNLLAARPPGMGLRLSGYLDNSHQNGGSRNNQPSLFVRKQRALEDDIDQNLSETCDNIDSPKTSPTTSTGKKFNFDCNGVNRIEHNPQYLSYLPGRMYHSINGQVTSPIYVPRSESRDSLGSTHSEPPHYRAQRERFKIFINTAHQLRVDSSAVQEKSTEWKEKTNLDFEDNSNIVSQLFKCLHSSPTHSASSNGSSSPASVSRQNFRPNSLETPRGAWEVPSRVANKPLNRNIPIENQNGLYTHSQRTTDSEEDNLNIPQTYTNVSGTPVNDEVFNNVNHLNSSPRRRILHKVKERHPENEPVFKHDDLNIFLNVPDNKRPTVKDRFPCDSSQCLENLEPSNFTANGYAVQPDVIDSQTNSLTNGDISENMLGKNQMDTIQENVVLRRKALGDVSHWSSTTTLKDQDSEGTSTDQTPLAVSRCSSLSSLTSCLQHSARSSWISDVSSRRTSGIISPSELPDSPGSDLKQVFQFTDRAPDAESLGLPRPRPAWPSSVSSVMSSESSLSVGPRLSSGSDMSIKPCELQTVGEATEQADFTTDVQERQSKLNLSPSRPQNTPEKDSCPSTESSSSQEDEHERDHDLLAACVDLGMPNNTSNGAQRNNSKLHSRVNNLSSNFTYLRSGIPVKSNNVRLTQTVQNVARPIVLSSCAAAPINQESLNIYAESSSKSVCDDNDNLLFRYSNLEQAADTSQVYDSSDMSITKSKDKSQYTNSSNFCELQQQLHNEPKVVASDSKTIQASKKYPTSTRHGGFSHREQNNQFPQVLGRQTHDRCQSYSNISGSESDENVQSGSCGQNYSATGPSLEENIENADQWSSPSELVKSESKSKTAIPQIVRPWHPSLDNEVHPKQLQIMSQNLPVYKGSFAIHCSDTGDKNGDSDHDRDSEENKNTVSEEEAYGVILRNGDLSSFSADSEDFSSADALQECIAAGKPQDRLQRNNRPKTKRNKHVRRSTEIIAPPDHSSEDDNKNSPVEEGRVRSLLANRYLGSVQSSDCEEKGKEDERTKEKSGQLASTSGTIPDLLEGATFHADIAARKGIEVRQQISVVKSNGSPKGMSDSMELRKGAMMVAAEMDEVADDYTHSSASCFSDLDNIKPPSVMGEISMTSSGLSDLLSNGNGCYVNGKHAVDRRRNLKRVKKVNGSHRFVFKSVRQAMDAARSAENPDKPPSVAGSVENLSMKSSGTSELLENINPPSVMDEISMTNSCASLNSISSDILESRSQSLADQRSNSEMYQRLNAAAAMVQVYSRELSNIMTGSTNAMTGSMNAMNGSTNIMTGSMKSSYNSDNLDQVKPPSVFQDIAEVTVEDGTEVASDALISDSELEEELPHDDESSVPSSDTVYSPLHLLTKTEQADGSTENLNSSFEGDSIGNVDKPHPSVKRISNLALTPQSTSIIDMSSNTILHTTQSLTISHETTDTDDELNVMKVQNIESIESSVKTSTPPPVRRGPRIVKPINRETVRQMQEKKNSEKVVKSIRGRASTNTSKNLLQRLAATRSCGPNKPTNLSNKATPISAVRPTRTSALRASQSQKQATVKSSSGRVSPRAVLSKPPSIRSGARHTKALPVASAGAVVSTSSIRICSEKTQSEENKRPQPPVKQGTFTKDEPTQNVPTISPFSPSDPNVLPEPRMTQSQTESTIIEHSVMSQDNDIIITKTAKVLVSPVNSVPKISSRKLSFCNMPTVKRSTSNYSLQRNLSAPLQRKNSIKGGLRPSPSSQSLGQDKLGKIFCGKGSSNGTTVDARGNSLSSLSSSNLSLKRANSQKEVTSKISSIWKKSDSSSSANSPVTDTSITERGASPGCRNKMVISKISAVAHRSSNITPTSSSQDSSGTHSSSSEKSKGFVNSSVARRPTTLRPATSNARETFTNGKLITNGTNGYKGNLVGKSQPPSLSKVVNGGSSAKVIAVHGKTSTGINQSFKNTSLNLQRNKFTRMQSQKTTNPYDEPMSFRSVHQNGGTSGQNGSCSYNGAVKTSPASAVVPPFNYIPSSDSKRSGYEVQLKTGTIDCDPSDSHISTETANDASEAADEEDSVCSENRPGTGKKCLVTMV